MRLTSISMPLLLLTTLFIAACSSDPQLPEDQGNSADEQRSRAEQAQDELSSETRK